MMEFHWGDRDPRWAGISSDRITIDGVDIHVLRADPTSVAAGGDLETGQHVDDGADPILLVHGLGGSATNWLDVMGGLARTAPVVAVDLPGFSETRPPTPRAARMAPQVAFLVRLLDTLAWERAEVHGNSMGGLLSILLAGRQPDRVPRLVLANPAFPGDVRASLVQLDRQSASRLAPFVVSRRAGLAALRALYRRSTPEEVYAGTESLVMGDAERMRPPLRDVGIAHATDAMRLEWRAESMSHAASDLLTTLTRRRREVREAAAAITADILLIWGDGDRLVNQAAMDALTTLRGDITRHDLAGVGHVPMIEVPDRYLALVDTWRTTVAVPA